MVLTSTRRASNKENSLAKTPLIGGKFGAKSLHKRTRYYRTQSLAPSSATRRTNHPGTAVPSASVLSLFVEGNSTEPESSAGASAAAAQRRISLSRRLQCPAFRAISPAAISAIDSDLSEVPIEYIHKRLRAVGEQLYATSSRVTAKCTPQGTLPRELEVVINDVSSEIPTHIFAVYSEPSASQKQRITLHPVHALILASQCAHLPPLPQSSATRDGNSATLPILPLRLPSPRTFALLLAYLYTHRSHDLLSALLPIPLSELPPEEHLRKLAETCTVPTLLSCAQTTHSLWSNVVALGIFDNALWRTLDHTWSALLAALAVKSRESPSSQ